VNSNFPHWSRTIGNPSRRGSTLSGTTALGAAALFLTFALAAGAQNPKPMVGAKTDNGKRLFASGCAACHGDLAQGVNGLGPRITPPPLAIAEFITYVRQPSGQMRAFSKDDLSDAQLVDVYAYLQSLSPPSTAPSQNLKGNATTGKDLFSNFGCYECHGFQAQGGGAGPRIGPNPIPFEALSAYVRKPTGTMPPFTTKVLTDQQLSDIYAYLQSLPPARKDVKSIPVVK
jgi:mono/diheme cytochrome c family protein